ncbi:1-phosphofructokinase family hexose kinase [Actinomyces trachealis]|uniref:1-phosphofructokinase family hexose kinase n=1 Tax=Actinomyces trachealis TaxID=2763540 RepID=UPI0018C80662|nr:hexose kinase [Actinomyces trachealis]
MITTLTPNPSLDRTVSLNGPLQRGGVNRLCDVRVEPGGKGINVARVLAWAGLPAKALFPASATDPLVRALNALPTPAPQVIPVQVRNAVRVNTAVTEPDGTTTKLNEPGQALDHTEVAALELALLEAAATGGGSAAGAGNHWAVLSGSLPPGAPEDWYPRLVQALRAACPGLYIAVDTSDAPLAALAHELPELAPDLIKPNGEELGQLAGLGQEAATSLEERALKGDLSLVVQAGQTLVSQGINTVLASLGPAGAVLVTPAGAWHASAPEVTVVSTVGAGDSSLAGYVLAHVQGGDEATCLTTAMAYGAAAASLPGTTLPTPADLPEQPASVTRLR